MSRPLDLGIASFQNPQKLDRTISQIRETCRSDWRLFVIDNASPDPGVRPVIEAHAAEDSRIIPVFRLSNVGYAGAVNHLLNLAHGTTPEVDQTFRRKNATPADHPRWLAEPSWEPRGDYVAYVDNDCYLFTPGWDLLMMEQLDRAPKVGMVFPGNSDWALDRPNYREIFWGVGFCWMLRMEVIEAMGCRDAGYPMMAHGDEGMFDTVIGHQEEVDFQTRLRLAGFVSACLPEIVAQHEASSSNSDASRERINAGVVRWMNKWNWIFYGEGQTYHSHNVMRIQDWPPYQLFFEELFKKQFPGLNESPAEVTVLGAEMDLVKVPKPRHYYRDRII